MSVSVLAEQLVYAGKLVNVYTTTANGLNELTVKPGEPIIVDGVNVTYFNRITKDHTHLSPSLLIKTWRTARDYDVIHIHAWWNLVSVLACFVALMCKVPVVVSPRGTLSSYTFNNRNNRVKSFIHFWLGKPLLKKCFIHTTSKNEYDVLKEMLPSNTIFNIPNFIKLDSEETFPVSQTTNHLKLIFFSRIEEKKGLDLLLDALMTVQVPYTLTIAGDGNIDYVNKLKQQALANGVADHINWIGFKTDDKFKLLHDHDLMILPSHDENFGNVVIESLSVGTPVLISRQVGLADYVKENNLGWLCETNAASISDSIKAIANKKADIDRIKSKAPLIIKSDFDYKNMVQKYINMYTQIGAK
jgi:glycosyltransferase involved in cell wall biosynthesis